MQRAILLILLYTLVAFILPANAEGGCPTGQYPQSGPGWQTCVPIPNYAGTQSAQQPVEQWSSRWGAVAASGEFMGISSGMDDKHSAEQKALDECAARGGTSCEIHHTYSNQCLAVMASTRVTWTENAATAAAAEQKGFKDCKSKGPEKCWTYYTGCSLPIRTQ